MSVQEKIILVVEDSRTVAATVKKVLESADWRISLVYSADEAIAWVQKNGLPHLALIDLNLGARSVDGFTLCDQLHQFSDLPIIMLTSESSEDSVVRGLQLYAEDYITKPFRAQELKVRVWRVMQRMGDFNYTLSAIMQVDEHLQIDFPHQRLLIDGVTHPLTPIESKLLYILLKYAGRTVRTDFLLRRIWPLEEVYEDRLHPHIYRLRKKIEQNPRKPQYIMADWGVGYLFPLPKTVL